VLVKEVYEILRAEYSPAFIVKYGSNPLLSLSNAIGSRDSVVVDHKVRAPVVLCRRHGYIYQFLQQKSSYPVEKQNPEFKLRYLQPEYA
jgi:hypothetical protein